MRILIVLLILVNHSFAQWGTLTGNIFNKQDKSPQIFGVVSVKDINKSTYTNQYGYFIIDSISIGEHILTVNCLGCSDTIMKINVVGNDTLKLSFTVPFKCNYDKGNKTCPICKKSDLVVPIVYGLILETRSKRRKKKELEFHSGGCVISGCDPNWYCKRDDKEF
jgi:hypothetical protein